MFRRNCWYVCAWSDELGDRDIVSRTLLGEQIVLWRPRRMIEAQAANIRSSPMTMIKSDIGLAHARHLVANRLRSEGAASSEVAEPT